MVTRSVTDGRGGVEEKPNRGGGSTGASRPRSVPSKWPDGGGDRAVARGAVPLAAVAGLAAGPDAPERQPGDGVGGGAPPRRAGDGARHEREQPAEGGTAAEGEAQVERGGPDPPGATVGEHGERLEPDLVELVGGGDEAGDVAVGREEHAVAGRRLDHRVGEGAQRGLEPVPDHHADAGGGADAGDVAPEGDAAAGHRMGAPDTVRAMTRRWISEVPSKIV